jgi:multiple antibiotic resistance protein
MSSLPGRFLQAFIPLLVAIDAVGLVAVFLAVSHGVSPARRLRMARQATVTAGAVALGFLFLGQSVFAALNITVSDFQVAGGLILLIIAGRELIQSSVLPDKLSEDFGVVPLGMPLIAGPATLTTLLATTQTVGLLVTLSALVVNLGLVVLALTYSENLGRLIGRTGLRAISKIIYLLLAAIAVAMIRRGWAG